MQSWGRLVIIGAYLIGLLATGITSDQILGSLSIAGIVVCALCGFGGFVGVRYWRMGPTSRQWWAAGVVGLVAASYCVAMSPQPSEIDVSRFASGQEWWVTGKVVQMPQKSRNNKGKFFLKAQIVQAVGSRSSFEAPQRVDGKLYVTAALKPSKRLYPGELVKLKGRISASLRSGDSTQSGFDRYLARQGCFAQFRTHWIEFLPDQAPPQWALWKLRARIVTAQGRWLGEPAGNLLSAMTMGRKAVDLPYTVKDSFIAAGLAHTLAASGFHVTLMLGLVLGILKNQPPKTKAMAGSLALLLYVGLTGLQASVIRASLMGMGALLGLAIDRKVKPLGGLMMAAVLILIWNPQWIWDVGFQLSVVATLGLILTVKRLMRFLDWMPTNVAGLVAVPIAAYLWTIPLQLLYFQVLPTYSVLLNAIATPLVVLISIGGFVSAIAAIIWPLIGSLMATCLYVPIHVLIWLVERFNQLPGSKFEITGINGWHVVISYGVYAAICIALWKHDRQTETSESAALSLQI